jgi:S-formylglutathione hydrolase FrmB
MTWLQRRGVPAFALIVLLLAVSVAQARPRDALADDPKPAAPPAPPSLGSDPPVGRTSPDTLVAGTGSWRTLAVPAPDLAAGSTRAVLVWAPPVADDRRTPVLYLLHGTPGTAGDLCGPAAAADLLAAFRAGSTPFVLACPDGNPAAQQDTEWADSTDGRTALERFVTQGVITAVEGTAVRPAGMRAIAGFSMGGFGAAAIALRHPTLYSQVGALAGYFHLDDPDRVFGTTAAMQAAHDPTALVAGAGGLRWYLAEAEQDDLTLTAHDAERYAMLLRSTGASVRLSNAAGGHSPSWAVAQLPSLARFLSAGWGRPAGS